MRADCRSMAALRRIVCLLLVLTAMPPAVRAQSIGQEALGYLSTFAFGKSLETWDQVKNFSAETVLDHNREGFRPSGMKLPGGHVLMPTLTGRMIFDDNIYREADKVGDLRTQVIGRTVLQTNLPRHALKIELDAMQDSFAVHDNLNSFNGGGRLDFRVDVTAADSIGASFESHLGHHEDFDSPGVDVPATPVPAVVTRGSAGYLHDAGRAYLALGGDFRREQIYDVRTFGGAMTDVSLASNDATGAFAFLGYRFSPGYRAFLAARGERFTYHQPSTDYGDHNTYLAETGLVFELNPLLQFTVYGGYEMVRFDETWRPNFGTTIFRGSLQWLPTRRMTIKLEAGQKLQEASSKYAYGALLQDATAHLEYDIYHNLTGILDLDVRNIALIGNSRQDFEWKAGGSLEYLVNENLALTLGYEHVTRVSNETKFNFDDNRFMATLRLSQ